MFARFLLIFLFVAAPQPAGAQVAVADSGDTAWMMICALLILIAALPGLLLRHAGIINLRHALAISTQTLAVAAGASLAWAIAGYSLAYGAGNRWLGGGEHLLLSQLSTLRPGMTVPESAFVLFQMSLAILAACLVPGAVTGRARIGWMAYFAPLWLLIVYAPVAHWAWGGGWLAELGVIDFAGGLVIHVAAGFSALTLSLILGRRGKSPTSEHAPILGMAGGALIWIGWFGIVGGWALGATDDAASAILNAHFAACAGALAWMMLNRLTAGRVKPTGAVSGAIAGLVAISPSAPLVGPAGAILLGAIAALVCRGVRALTRRRVDDPAQTFVLHGVAGATGLILLPIFVQPTLGGVGFEAGISAVSALTAQAIGILVVALWAIVGSAIIAGLLSVMLPPRGTAEEEAEGLDAHQHHQQAWDFR